MLASLAEHDPATREELGGLVAHAGRTRGIEGLQQCTELKHLHFPAGGWEVSRE